jgi:hypothetical protein
MAKLSREAIAALGGVGFVVLYVVVLVVVMLVVLVPPTVKIQAPQVKAAGTTAGYQPTCDIVCNSTLVKTAVKNKNGWEDAKGGQMKAGTKLDAPTCVCEPSAELPWGSVLGNVPLPGNNGTKTCDQFCNETVFGAPTRQLLQSMGFSGSMVAQPGAPGTAQGDQGVCQCQLTNMPGNFSSLP